MDVMQKVRVNIWVNPESLMRFLELLKTLNDLPLEGINDYYDNYGKPEVHYVNTQQSAYNSVSLTSDLWVKFQLLENLGNK
jgi:hypothetical protein